MNVGAPSLGEGLQWRKASSHSMAQQGKQELWLVSARLTLRLFHFLTIRLPSAAQIDETRSHNSRLGVC